MVLPLNIQDASHGYQEAFGGLVDIMNTLRHPNIGNILKVLTKKETN